MNRSDARATKTLDGWTAEYRLVHWSSYRTVTERDARGRDRPATYANRDKAEIAAWKALRDAEQPIVRGERQSGSILARAEEEFAKLFGGAA